MFLSHQTIERYIQEKKIVIGPEYNPNNLRPVGIRLHLADTVLIPEPNQVVDLTEPTELRYTQVNLTAQSFYLEPNGFILGSTYEIIQTAPTILAMLDGRSTLARLGLAIHTTAAIIDGTFGQPHAPTLEIKNVGNFSIRLRYKDPIAMLLFAELQEPVTQPLQSQYGSTPHKVMPPNLQFKTGCDT